MWIGIASLALLTSLVAVDRVAYATVSFALSKSTYRYVEFYNDPDFHTDVFIIGDSRAGNHFPRSSYQDLKILNLGRGGTGFPLLAAQTKDYIDLHGAPDLVVIESWFLGSPAWGRDHGAIQSVFSDRVDDLVMSEVSPFEQLARRTFETTRFNENNFINALAGIFIDSFDSDPPSNGTITDAMKSRLLQLDNHVEMTDQNAADLADLLDFLNEHGARVVIVTTPMHPLAVASFDGIDAFVNRVDEIASAHGVEYLDYLHLYDEDRFFADPVHLNRRGAQCFDSIVFPAIMGGRVQTVNESFCQ